MACVGGDRRSKVGFLLDEGGKSWAQQVVKDGEVSWSADFNDILASRSSTSRGTRLGISSCHGNPRPSCAVSSSDKEITPGQALPLVV